MHPQQLEIKDFTYQLPDERIARYPVAERDLSKLLVYRNGEIKEDVYRHIADYLPENSTLFFNNTRVIPARIIFENAGGAKIEIFCLEPAVVTEMASAMSKTGSSIWQCLVGRAAKWKEKQLQIVAPDYRLCAEIVERKGDAFNIAFNWEPASLTFAEILDKTGMMPIPPYLKRTSEEVDLSRYQTVYAKHKGSVAAPTAGLHFTHNVFESLRAKKIDCEYLTLHVGAGTFKPVKTATVGGHEMHAEIMEVEAPAIEQLLQKLIARENNTNAGAPIVAVGTTALRTLESLYWMGIKLLQNKNLLITDLEVRQWDPYQPDGQISSAIPASMAFQAITSWMKKNEQAKLIAKTQIMIAPGYKLKVADALITNFHQPDSTLLLLVAALLGDDWKRIYDYALNHQFRFLSYGDGSLLFP